MARSSRWHRYLACESTLVAKGLIAKRKPKSKRTTNPNKVIDTSKYIITSTCEEKEVDAAFKHAINNYVSGRGCDREHPWYNGNMITKLEDPVNASYSNIMQSFAVIDESLHVKIQFSLNEKYFNWDDESLMVFDDLRPMLKQFNGWDVFRKLVALFGITKREGGVITIYIPYLKLLTDWTMPVMPKSLLLKGRNTPFYSAIDDFYGYGWQAEHLMPWLVELGSPVRAITTDEIGLGSGYGNTLHNTLCMIHGFTLSDLRPRVNSKQFMGPIRRPAPSGMRKSDDETARKLALLKQFKF